MPDKTSTTTAKVVSLPVRLVCSACGADGQGSCQCGAPYIPKSQRAAEAIAANPEKSDRAIAAEIGVSHEAVSKVRRSTVNLLTVDAKRTGRDGKTRKVPERAQSQRKAGPKPGQKQHQASVNSRPEDWERFKAVAAKEGISAADKLGRYVESVANDHTEKTVSIHELIEKLVPLAEQIRDQGKRHAALVSQGALVIVASEIRRLLDKWAEGDASIRRVNGHVVPPKHPAK
jgi:hypothetical protein